MEDLNPVLSDLERKLCQYFQVLNLTNPELDQLADFLGHDIRVHRQFYRLPEGTLQLAWKCQTKTLPIAEITLKIPKCGVCVCFFVFIKYRMIFHIVVIDMLTA